MWLEFPRETSYEKLQNLIAAILELSLFGALGASAQNVLTNPGFEYGDLTGWTIAGGSASTSVTV